MIPALIYMLACASSKKKPPAPEEEYPNPVQLTPPQKDDKVRPSKIYIDSVRVVDTEHNPVLLIMGIFPDGCTHIGKAGHQISGNSISLALEVWRDPDKMCTQALVPFSFIYRELPEKDLLSANSIQINGDTYNLTR